MKTRKYRAFTREQILKIQNYATLTRGSNELSLLVCLFINSTLSIRSLIGWFNSEKSSRLEYLRKNEKINQFLEDVVNAKILFTKTHQTYLSQWKHQCSILTGVNDATFEMLRRDTMN
jgi:hypothetical protein